MSILDIEKMTQEWVEMNSNLMYNKYHELGDEFWVAVIRDVHHTCKSSNIYRCNNILHYGPYSYNTLYGYVNKLLLSLEKAPYYNSNNGFIIDIVT